MKKILIMLSLLLLASCSSEEESQKDMNLEETESIDQEEESTAVEENNESEVKIGEIVEKNYHMTQAELEGTYKYNTNDKKTEGIFEEGGTLRIKDGSGNLRYYVNEEYGRVVIDSNIYLVNKMESGYELIGIDKNSKRTDNNITLINLN